ncbi:MAG: hypothetical protein ABS948_04780 [Solibacillus sp.]
MKKVGLIAVLIGSVFVGVLPSVQAAEEKLGAFSEVSTEKEWAITFNSDKITLQDVEVELVDDKGIEQEIILEKAGHQVIVKPKLPYEYGAQYRLRAQVKNAKKSDWKQIDFKTEQLKIENPVTLARIADITAQYEQWKPAYNGEVYSVKPSIQPPYDAGKLHDAVLTDALNTTKLMRFIADLPTTIQLKDRFNQEAQAAALVNTINPSLSHYPDRPPGMETKLYELAYEGASTSNLSKGRDSIVDSIVYGYMNDGDASNIDRVGHRMWVLSPKLNYVGFGLVTDTEGDWRTKASAMKVIEEDMYENKAAKYDYISWPAKTAMPTNYFGASYPWSFSLNPELYDVNYADNIDVTVTRLTDNQTWRFSEEKAEGYFHISTGNYGFLPYTIIFRPESAMAENGKASYIDYRHGESYKVEIANVRRKNGETTTIEFETTFFTLDK